MCAMPESPDCPTHNPEVARSNPAPATTKTQRPADSAGDACLAAAERRAGGCVGRRPCRRGVEASRDRVGVKRPALLVADEFNDRPRKRLNRATPPKLSTGCGQTPTATTTLR